jgi:hypothetical protein
MASSRRRPGEAPIELFGVDCMSAYAGAGAKFLLTAVARANSAKDDRCERTKTFRPCD